MPLVIIGQYEEMSGSFYYGILRGIREFKFLAKRNTITALTQIIVAIVLSYTVLGIVGVWMSYAIYCIVQKQLSKHKYKVIEGEIKQ